MQRRALLRAAALAGVAGIAGCTTDGDGGGSGTPTDTDEPTDGPADGPDEGTPTRTPTGGPVGESFEVVEGGCGTGRNAVDVTFDGASVRLDGVIDGDDACYTAEQESVAYDGAANRLRVAVRAYRPDDAGACADCIVDIEYEAEYVFEGSTPDEVVVVHDGETVATATRGDGSASVRRPG